MFKPDPDDRYRIESQDVQKCLEARDTKQGFSVILSDEKIELWSFVKHGKREYKIQSVASEACRHLLYLTVKDGRVAVCMDDKRHQVSIWTIVKHETQDTYSISTSSVENPDNDVYLSVDNLGGLGIIEESSSNDVNFGEERAWNIVHVSQTGSYSTSEPPNYDSVTEDASKEEVSTPKEHQPTQPAQPEKIDLAKGLYRFKNCHMNQYLHIGNNPTYYALLYNGPNSFKYIACRYSTKESKSWLTLDSLSNNHTDVDVTFERAADPSGGFRYRILLENKTLALGGAVLSIPGYSDGARTPIAAPYAINSIVARDLKSLNIADDWYWWKIQRKDENITTI